MTKPVFVSIFMILFLLLTACGSAVDFGFEINTDPEYDREAAQRTLSAANVSINATQRAQDRRSQRATEYAHETEQSINRQATQQAGQITATAAAYAYQATATKAAWESVQTQTAVSAQVTAAASATAQAAHATVVSMRATQTTIAVQVARAQRQAEIQRYTDTLLSVLFVAAVLTFFVLLVIGLVKAWPAIYGWMKGKEMQARTVAVGAEALVFLDPDRQMDVIQPMRNFGAAIRQGPEGVQVTGIAPDIDLQAGVTTRQQAAHLAANVRFSGGRSLVGQQTMLPAQGVRVLNPDDLPPMFGGGEALKQLDAQWEKSDD